VLDVTGMISPERRTLAANWSALRFVLKDKSLHPVMDLSDTQINASPPYAADKPVRAVSPVGPVVPAAPVVSAPASPATAPAPVGASPPAIPASIARAPR
jgi:hypothetical protein